MLKVPGLKGKNPFAGSEDGRRQKKSYRAFEVL
jgi:hypothetical protein